MSHFTETDETGWRVVVLYAFGMLAFTTFLLCRVKAKASIEQEPTPRVSPPGNRVSADARYVSRETESCCDGVDLGGSWLPIWAFVVVGAALFLLPVALNFIS